MLRRSAAVGYRDEVGVTKGISFPVERTLEQLLFKSADSGVCAVPGTGARDVYVRVEYASGGGGGVIVMGAAGGECGWGDFAGFGEGAVERSPGKYGLHREPAVVNKGVGLRDLSGAWRAVRCCGSRRPSGGGRR